MDARVTNYALENNISDINKLKTNPDISKTLFEIETHLALLYQLGYRQMPYDMQEIIMTGKYPENFQDKNPSPFTTIDPKDEHRKSFKTLYGGLFQEIFELREFEPYGHFTFQTATNKITVFDTAAQTGFLIDPVAFAYDFGARMYDARLGRWLSLDPMAKNQPGWSPYKAFNNNPLVFIDPEGRTEYNALTINDQRTGKTFTILAPINDKYVEKKIYSRSSLGGDMTYEYGYYHKVNNTTITIDKNGKTTTSKNSFLSKAPAYTREAAFQWIDRPNKLMDGGDIAGEGDFQEGGFRFTSEAGGADPTKYKALNNVESADLGDLLTALGAISGGDVPRVLEGAGFIQSITETTKDIIDDRSKKVCNNCDKILDKKDSMHYTVGEGTRDTIIEPKK